MADTTSWTEANITELEQAIASGVDTVSYSGGGTSRMIRYQSIEAMMRALDLMKRAVRGNTRRGRLVKYSKGWRDQ